MAASIQSYILYDTKCDFADAKVPRGAQQAGKVKSMDMFGVIRLPRQILFGRGQSGAIGAIAARLGSRALVCTDARFASTQACAAILSDLRSAGISAAVYDQVQPDLPKDSVGRCVEQVKDFEPALVIGIGGGSCLDMAKCTALILSQGGRLEDYYGEFKVPGPTLPVIAVPTTAGTGSEVTPVAVISDPDLTLKVGISSPHLIPHSAVCDPLLTMTCPPSLTAIAGADALTHAIEAFTAAQRTPTAGLAQKHVFVGKSVLTDHFALLAIRLLGKSLVEAYKNGANEEARGDVMMGALAAGCAFGTAGTGAAHAIQYPAGALTHTAHGLGVATLMPYVMAYNRDASLNAMAEIAEALGVDGRGRSVMELADAAISKVAGIFQAIGITPTLAALGLPEDKLEWTAEAAFGIERLLKNNPRPLDLSSLKRLIGAAFVGDLAAAAL
jgi:alcohol dehydrogenase class IV